MTHQRSNHRSRNATRQQVGGEPVAQHVRREFRDAERLAPSREDVLDLARAADQPPVGTSRCHKSTQHRHECLADRSVAVDVLAAHEQPAPVDVHVGGRQSRDLGPSHAGAPDQLDDVGMVDVLGADLRDGGLNGRRVDDLVATAARTRQLHPGERVDAEPAARHGQAHDAAKGAEFLLQDRLEGHAASTPLRQVEPDRALVDALQLHATAEQGGQFVVGPSVELERAFRRAGLGQVSLEHRQRVGQREFSAPARVDGSEGRGPLAGLVHGREGRAVGAAPEHRDHTAEPVAMPADVRGGDRNQSLLGSHGAAKGAGRGAKEQQEGMQTMQQHGTTKEERWERDGNQGLGWQAGGSAVAVATADPCGDSSEAAGQPQLRRIGRQATIQGAKPGATRNRLPVGPTEAELMTGYQNTSTPAQGQNTNQPTPNPTAKLKESATGPEVAEARSVTSPARADSLSGGVA